jgi:hypothetical protein
MAGMIPIGGVGGGGPSSGPTTDPNYQGEVEFFSDLPLVGNSVGDVYYVENGQGVWGVNRKPADYYIWTGSDWRGQYNKLVSVTGLGFTGAQEVLSASTGAIIQSALDGKVDGPGVAVNGNIATFDGATGKLIQDSGLSATGVSSHIANTSNPHQVTASQALAQDPGTDATVAELEQLTDGSFADSLHKHFEIGNTTQTSFVRTLAGNLIQFITNNVVNMSLDAVGNLALFQYLQNTRDDGTVADQKVLTTNPAGGVLLRKVLPYLASTTDDVGGINQTTTLTTYIDLNFTITEDGEYPLEWFYVWSANTTTQDFIGQVVLDTNPPSAADVLMDHRQEPKDAGGPGVLLPNLNGGPDVNSGTNQRHVLSGFTTRNLTAGDYTMRIDIAGSQNNLEPAVYQGSLKVGHQTNV